MSDDSPLFFCLACHEGVHWESAEVHAFADFNEGGCPGEDKCSPTAVTTVRHGLVLIMEERMARVAASVMGDLFKRIMRADPLGRPDTQLQAGEAGRKA